MGSELIIKKIKSRALKLTIFTAIIALLFALFAFALFVGEAPALGIIIVIFALLMFIIMFVCLHQYVKPMSARCFKSNPKLLEQADELFRDIVYQDKFIICSNRIIANAKDIIQMGAFDEITDVCEYTYSYNFVPTTHTITLMLPNYKILINVYGKKKDTINKLKYNIIQHCPKVLEKQFKFGARIE